MYHFLGLMNYLKRFIPQYSVITQPLRKLLQKETTWYWGNNCECSFEKLKQSLSSNTILYTGASLHEISAILLQFKPKKRP